MRAHEKQTPIYFVPDGRSVSTGNTASLRPALGEHMSADLNSLLAPNDDKQFEQLCQHVLEHRWKTLRGQAYGRPGQAQHGVDFYIEVPACGGESGPGAVQIIGVQCKHKDHLLEGELGVKELADEVKKAKEFTPALTTFI